LDEVRNSIDHQDGDLGIALWVRGSSHRLASLVLFVPVLGRAERR